MQSSTSASSTFQTFQTILAEETRELFLILLSAIAWWYFEGMRNHLRNFLNQQFGASPPSNLKLKYVKFLEHEDTKVDGSSSEPESELSTTLNNLQTSTNPAVHEPADLSEPESQDKIDSKNAITASVAPPSSLVFFPPPGLELPGLMPAPADSQEKSKRRKKANIEPKPPPQIPERELGRCVCWKDCFGFIVDESGGRFFVRQTDIQGENALMAGQVVWFRRGKSQKGDKTKRAVDISLVDIELAKMLRSAERDGISWTDFRTAVVDDDAKVLASFKCLKNIPNHKSKLAIFKAEAARSSGDKAKPVEAETANDADLKAFLGSGSEEEIRANLKYAPQWVADKLKAHT